MSEKKKSEMGKKLCQQFFYVLYELMTSSSMDTSEH